MKLGRPLVLLTACAAGMSAGPDGPGDAPSNPAQNYRMLHLALIIQVAGVPPPILGGNAVAPGPP